MSQPIKVHLTRLPGASNGGGLSRAHHRSGAVSMKLRRTWSEQDDAELAKALSEGVSLQRLVIRLKRQESTIRTRAKVLGLGIKPVKRLSAQERLIR